MPSIDLPPDFLDLPVEHAARIVAIALLFEAEEARERLLNPDDDEALHDFRVALRRLRSWARAYRGPLETSIDGKSRRRLKALARATGAARDVEVQLAWLDKQKAELDNLQQPGLTHYRNRLARRQHEAEAELRSEVARDFGRVARRLEGALPTYVLSGRIDEAPPSCPMRLATARAVERANRTLGERLSRVHSVADAAKAHEARIAGKRVRYILEPLTGVVPDAGQVVEQLKRFQDVAGELHDAVVLLQDVVSEAEGLSPTDPAHAGLVALTALLRVREAAALAALERDWLGERAGELTRRVDALAHALISSGESDQEIERKYLLRAVPERARTGAKRDIEQGYLPGKRLSERLRRVREGRAIRRYRTVKVGSGLVRTQVEEETTARVFNTMWPLTEGRRVHKTRYEVPDNGHVWEIDEFRDRDLVLAEIELPTPEDDVAPPSWLAPFIVREVTGDPGYDNATLAK